MSVQPRETLQQQYIRQLKQAVANILHMLMEYAGKPNKPNAATGAINGEIGLVDDAIKRLGPSPNLRNDVKTAWPVFKAHWNNGTGSWTTCRDEATQLNKYLQNTDF